MLGGEPAIRAVAESFIEKDHSLFLGRGRALPCGSGRGALKLKEISYIHAEGYPAGELKHGPLALVDEDMPVVCIAPSDELLDKVKSNLQEVAARGGKYIVFTDHGAEFAGEDGLTTVILPEVPPFCHRWCMWCLCSSLPITSRLCEARMLISHVIWPSRSLWNSLVSVI